MKLNTRIYFAQKFFGVCFDMTWTVLVQIKFKFQNHSTLGNMTLMEVKMWIYIGNLFNAPSFFDQLKNNKAIGLNFFTINRHLFAT